MEIAPASLAMFTKGKNGRLIPIDDDVQGCANALNEIDPHLRLRYSEVGEYFVVYWKPEEAEEGDGYMISTAQELDHRLVAHVGAIYKRCQEPGYSFGEELDRLDAEDKKAKDDAFSEEHGEMFERMAHAMRKDLGYDKARAFVPKDLTRV
jgi:hypothetical protein